MEKYLGWIIDEHDVALGFFRGDGQVKLEANVFPDIEHLYNFLKDNNIVSTSFSYLIDVVRIYSYRNSYGYSFQRSLSYSEEKDLKILNAVAEYSNATKYSITKTAHAILSISQTGGERTRARAMGKIKEWVRDSLPNPRQGVIAFLKRENLISQSVNPFCEILTKNI